MNIELKHSNEKLTPCKNNCFGKYLFIKLGA